MKRMFRMPFLPRYMKLTVRAITPCMDRRFLLGPALRRLVSRVFGLSCVAANIEHIVLMKGASLGPGTWRASYRLPIQGFQPPCIITRRSSQGHSPQTDI